MMNGLTMCAYTRWGRSLCNMLCMKGITSLMYVLLLIGVPLFGQTTLSFLPMDADKARTYDQISHIDLPENTRFLQPSIPSMEALQGNQQAVINLTVPMDADRNIQLLLVEQSIFNPGAKLSSSDGSEEYLLHDMGRHYQGQIDGLQGSMAAVSIFKGQLYATFSFEGKNYNLEQLQVGEHQRAAPYLLYPEPALSSSFTCHTDDLEDIMELPFVKEIERKSKHARSVSNIQIYLECDYKVYQDKGGVTNAANYATGLFNVVKTIYADAGVTLVISGLKVWNTPDPYGATSGNNSFEVLNAFEAENCSYDGHIAHLLSTSSANLGGIANRPGCSGGSYTGTIHGFSNIHTSYNSNLNVYSWSVNVLAHELGHNMSSPHTHACEWNGNNTQIDDCGNAYVSNPGSCYNASSPIIPTKGTIMSYCHLSTGNGIDLSTGFHSQVADKIFEFAGCLSNGVTGCPTASLDDLSANPTGQGATLTCSVTTGVSYYYWGYRSIGSSSYTYSPGTTSANQYTISSLSNGDYEFIVVLYCDTEGWGGFSCPQDFSVGGDCPNTVELSEVPIPSGTYEASNSIMADGMIMNNGQVTMSAGNTVDLNAGFEVAAGGIMEVMIEGCP